MRIAVSYPAKRRVRSVVAYKAVVRLTGDSDLTVAALLAPGTISYQEVYERKEFLVAGGI